ncbi:YvrJ family protein [Salinicoccus carnicancri]|nr:YvrJ family protein [Salinicoccus carnicancri]
MEWVTLVSDVGFPAAITFFLLYRMESKLDDLIISIRELH